MMWKCKPINPFLPVAFGHWVSSEVVHLSNYCFQDLPCVAPPQSQDIFSDHSMLPCVRIDTHPWFYLLLCLQVFSSLASVSTQGWIKDLFHGLLFFVVAKQLKGRKTSWAYTSRSLVTMEGRQSRNRRRNHGGVPLLWPPSSWVMLG